LIGPPTSVTKGKASSIAVGHALSATGRRHLQQKRRGVDRSVTRPALMRTYRPPGQLRPSPAPQPRRPQDGQQHSKPSLRRPKGALEDPSSSNYDGLKIAEKVIYFKFLGNVGKKKALAPRTRAHHLKRGFKQRLWDGELSYRTVDMSNRKQYSRAVFARLNAPLPAHRRICRTGLWPAASCTKRGRDGRAHSSG